MRQTRALVVIADDFGMGPATTQGILDLARRELVTGSVLMVNSPYAEEGVRAWRSAGCPLELGWHPTLTSDAPVLRPEHTAIGGEAARGPGFPRNTIRGLVRILRASYPRQRGSS